MNGIGKVEKRCLNQNKEMDGRQHIPSSEPQWGSINKSKLGVHPKGPGEPAEFSSHGPLLIVCWFL